MFQYCCLIIFLVNYVHVNELRTSFYSVWTCSNLNVKDSPPRYHRKVHFCYLFKSSPTASTPVKTQQWQSETEHLAETSRAPGTRDAEVPPAQSSATSFPRSNTELYLTSACCIAKKHRESHSIHHSYIKTLRGHARMKEVKIRQNQQDFSW